MEPATSLKVTHLHGCFSHFLNCTDGAKSRNASHIKISPYAAEVVAISVVT